MAHFSDMLEGVFGKNAKEEIQRGVKDLNERLNDFLNKSGDSAASNPTQKAANSQAPSVNIIEAPDHFRVEVAACGFTKEQFKLTLDNGGLVIKGQKDDTPPVAGERYLRQEFSTSNFERSFMLPDTIDTSKIAASCNNGILVVTLGKKEEAIVKSGVDITIN
jgi:HSP20 family protein